MKRAGLLLITSCLLAVFAAGAAAGSFRGTVVNGPNSGADKQWVYVQGRDGNIRRVDISNARVTYDAAVPKHVRTPKASDSIREGADVRVTASQDGNGEWKASSIEVLKAADRKSVV